MPCASDWSISSARPRGWRRVAAGDQPLDGVAAMARDCVRAEAEIAEPHDLALAHRDAAENLRQDIRRGRSGSAAPRSRRSGLRLRAARDRRAFRGSPRHRSRARRARARRAARCSMQIGGQRAVGADRAPHGGRRLELQRLDFGQSGAGILGPGGLGGGRQKRGRCSAWGAPSSLTLHGSLAFAVQQ